MCDGRGVPDSDSVRARVAPDQQGRETVFDGGPLEVRLLVQACQSAVAVQVAPERLQ